MYGCGFYETLCTFGGFEPKEIIWFYPRTCDMDIPVIYSAPVYIRRATLGLSPVSIDAAVEI